MKKIFLIILILLSFLLYWFAKQEKQTQDNKTQSWYLYNSFNISKKCNLLWHEQDRSVDYVKKYFGPIDCNTFEIFNTNTKTFEKISFENEPIPWTYARDKNGYYYYSSNYLADYWPNYWAFIRITNDKKAIFKIVGDLFYVKDSKKLYYKWNILDNTTDENSLKLIKKGKNFSYIKLFSDKKHVWIDWELVDKANPKTFHIISYTENEYYYTKKYYTKIIAADNNYCYIIWNNYNSFNTYIIPWCDPKGLKYLWKWFLTDWKAIFADWNEWYIKLNIPNAKNFKVPNNALAECYRNNTWESYSNWETSSWYIDCKTAKYLDTANKQFKPISQFDVLPKEWYLIDNNWSYYFYTEQNCWGDYCKNNKISSESWVTIINIWNTTFLKDSKNIFFGYFVLTWAIEKDLHVLDDGWGWDYFSDSNHVWIGWYLLDKADAKTFKFKPEVENWEFYQLATDKNHCYYYYKEEYQIPKIIEWCNPKNFKDLWYWYSTDWINIFSAISKIDVDIKTFNPIKLRLYDYALATDKNYCYFSYLNYWSISKIEWCNPKKFKDLWEWYSTDWINIFIAEKKLDNVDVKTFKTTKTDYSRSNYVLFSDKNYCYYYSKEYQIPKIIEWCNPKNFKDLWYWYSTDWVTLFEYITKIDGIDPNTFKLPKN